MAKFDTDRFGTVEVPEDQEIEFGRGLLGFENLRRFVHLEPDEAAPFGWLQSLEDPGLAFVVANPAAFYPDYRVEIDPRELGEVRPGPNDRLVVLCICTVPEERAAISMNLQGPLIINAATRRGKQVVLNRSPYGTHHRLLGGGDEAGRKPSGSRKRSNRPRSTEASKAV